MPGVTVTATAGDFQRKVVTSSSGRYRFDDLAAGTYRLQAELAGFRRTVAEGIVVGSGSEVQHDLVMRIGILTHADLVGLPSGGLAGALRAADAVIHLRVARVVGVQLIGPSQARLTSSKARPCISGRRSPASGWRTVAGWSARARRTKSVTSLSACSHESKTPS
jgi:Carboxypeptidase regulatory-like domain